MFFFHIMYSNIHSVALLPLAYIAVEFLANHISSSLCCYGSLKSALDQQKRQSRHLFAVSDSRGSFSGDSQSNLKQSGTVGLDNDSLV